MMRLLTCGCPHSWCCWSPPTSECIAASPGHLSLLRWRDWMANRAWYCPSYIQKIFGKIKDFGGYFLTLCMPSYLLPESGSHCLVIENGVVHQIGITLLPSIL